MAPQEPGTFDLVLVPGSNQSLAVVPFEAFKYNKMTGELQSVPVPAFADTKEFSVIHSQRGQRLYSQAVKNADYLHERVLLRTLSADGSISSVQQEVVLDGWIQDMAIDGSGSWLIVLRGGYFGTGARYWIETYPAASDGTLGTPQNIWQAPAPVLFPGASAAPQWVTILNRSSNNQDIWVWNHTYQLDSDEAFLGEDGTLYKITIDAETGTVGNAVSRDLGQEVDSPQLAQGNDFVFMGRTYSGGLKTISSSTLDQVAVCTLNSHPTCEDPFGLTTRADGTRLFTISRKGTVSSLTVNANGAVQPLASQTMAVKGIPFEVASDADGTHLFVSSYDGYPSLVRRITAFKVLQDGALIEGASVVSNNAEQIQVLSH